MRDVRAVAVYVTTSAHHPHYRDNRTDALRQTYGKVLEGAELQSQTNEEIRCGSCSVCQRCTVLIPPLQCVTVRTGNYCATCCEVIEGKRNLRQNVTDDAHTTHADSPVVGTQENDASTEGASTSLQMRRWAAPAIGQNPYAEIADRRGRTQQSLAHRLEDTRTQEPNSRKDEETSADALRSGAEPARSAKRLKLSKAFRITSDDACRSVNPVGLALGVFPPVIFFVEWYSSKWYISRLLGSAREIKHLADSLRDSEQLFVNSVHDLLRSTVPPVELKILLDDVQGDLWRNGRLDERVVEQLGPEAADRIRESVDNIRKTVLKLKQRLAVRRSTVRPDMLLPR